jgi:serine/threonine protein kinase
MEPRESRDPEGIPARCYCGLNRAFFVLQTGDRAVNENSLNSGQSLDPAGQAHVHELRERFEAALKAGQSPPIEDYLGAVAEPLRATLLLELLRLDVIYRSKQGDNPAPQDYLKQFPAHGDLIGRLFDEPATAFARPLTEVSVRPADHQDAPGRPVSAGDRICAEESPVPRSPESTVDDRPPESAERYPTSRVPRFRPLRFHARGGLGEVWVAEDRELGREVALKQIQERHRDNPDSRRRFLREAEITGRLQHPGIVPIYGLEQNFDGQPSYAMNFIEGENLQAAIERFHSAETMKRDPGRRSLELRRLLNHLVVVCNTIAYAHSRGVLHRDLKPANIMLGRYGETQVVDWGLAKSGVGSPESGVAESRSQEQPGEEPLLPCAPLIAGSTEPGLQLGTPAYMSPEQAAGEVRLGPATDIYGLGATLYAILTGQSPVQGSDREKVYERVRRGDFPRPCQIRPEVPRALEAVCLKAMALHPEQRYATAQALAGDIEQWLADEPVSAWREPRSVRLRRWARRRRVLVTGLAVGLVLVCLGLGVGGPMISSLRQQVLVERSLAQFADLERDVREAQLEGRVGRWQEALDRLDAVLDAGHPEPVRIRLERYKALSGKGDVPACKREVEALAALDEAELGPYAGPVLLRSGERLLAQNQLRQGRAKIQQARLRGLDEADDAFAQAMLAPTVPESAHHLRTALERDPFHQEAHRFYLTTLLLQGNTQEAIQEAELCRRLFPDDTSLELAGAVVAAFDGRVEEANGILDQRQKTLGTDTVRDLKKKVMAATHLAASAMDNWDEPLGLKDLTQVQDFVRLFTSVTGGDNVLLFQFPPAFAELLLQMTEKGAAIPDLLMQLGKRPWFERILEVMPDGSLYFLDGLKYGVETEANAAKMEAAMLKAADTPSLIANVRREALYCAAMSAGAQYLLAEKRHSPQARGHLDRAVGYVRQRLELGPLRSVHGDYFFKVARRGRVYDLALVINAERLRKAPGDLNLLTERAQMELLAGSYQVALATADQVLARQPENHDARRYRAEAILGLNAVLHGNEPPDAATVRRALGRPPEDAAVETDKRMAGPSASDFYNAAHVHALAAVALPAGPKREGHESRALELLGKARAAGYFDYPPNVDMFQVERGFALLRDRPEVQKLVPQPDRDK